MVKELNRVIIYIDMDDTLCDYKSAFIKAHKEDPCTQFPQSVPGFFLNLKPLPEAIETFHWFVEQPQFDVYILTAPSPKNPHCYTEKRLWVEENLGYDAVEKLIISQHKHLSLGAYLIDDCDKGKGQEGFEGRLIRFGYDQFQDWLSVRAYFEKLLQTGVEGQSKSRVHPEVLCFRAFDMRDRFSEPVATFREALQLLQSDRAYLPDWNSEIICYLRSGQSIPIPELFYLINKTRFSSREDAEKWVKERAEEIKTKSGFALGLLVADPDLPIEEQIDQALAHTDTEVIDSSENDRICDELDNWLSVAIKNLPKKQPKDTDSGHSKTLSTPLESDKANTETAYAPTLSESDVADFAAMFEQTCGASRWFIASDYAHTEEADSTSYLDIANNEWVASVNEATCFKQSNLAHVVCETLDSDFKASVKKFLVSNTELTKKAIKIEVDRQVIAHHEESKTYLYDTQGIKGVFSPNALLHIQNPNEFTIDKSELGGENITVSIHPEAMDDLAIAWCKHRKLQGALGGPVGKEWGSPDCDYD